MHIGSPERRDVRSTVDSVTDTIVNNVESVEWLKEEYADRVKITNQKGGELNPEGIVKGLVGEMVAEMTPFSESNLVFGRENLTQIGIIKLQTTKIGGVILEGNTAQYSVKEKKKNLLAFLNGGGVPTKRNFFAAKRKIEDSELYKSETAMPDMWGGIVGIQGLAFPVEVKCYTAEELDAYVNASKGKDKLEKIEVEVSGQKMNLGFDIGGQLDLIDWARQRVGLPPLSNSDEPRPVLLRVPKGYNHEQLQTLKEVADKGRYGKKNQKVSLLIEEMPYTDAELGLIAEKVAKKMDVTPVENGARMETMTPNDQELDKQIEAVEELIKAVKNKDREAYESARLKLKVRFGLR